MEIKPFRECEFPHIVKVDEVATSYPSASSRIHLLLFHQPLSLCRPLFVFLRHYSDMIINKGGVSLRVPNTISVFLTVLVAYVIYGDLKIWGAYEVIFTYATKIRSKLIEFINFLMH